MEWTSNLLTKILQRPRLAAYLEQSTRYIAYDTQLDAYGYRYHRDARFGPEYERAMDDLFSTYSRLLEGVSAWVEGAVPAQRRRIRCRAHARGAREGARPRARPAARRVALAHGHVRERPDVRAARAAPARASARRGARVRRRCCSRSCRRSSRASSTRVPREDRGGRWIEFLRERRVAADAVAARLGLDEEHGAGSAVGAAAARARHRGGAARRAALRVDGDRRGRGATRGVCARRRTSAPRSCAS